MKQTDYHALLREAIEAGRNRDYLRSVDLLSRITSETDLEPEAFLYLGRSYHALGRYDLAIPAFRSFIELTPKSGAGYFFLGRAYLSLGAPAIAVQNLKRALEHNPNSPTALSLIGFAYLKVHRPEIAADYLGRAVTLNPQNKRLYTGYLNALLVQAIRTFHHGDLDLANQMLQFIGSHGGDGILLHLYLASINRELGNLREALEHYDIAVKMAPDDPSIRLQRAVLLQRMGESRIATEELRQLDLTPNPEQFSWDPSSTNRVLAVQHFQRGQYSVAIFHAEKVLRELSKDVDMHLLVGESYRLLGDFQKATNHFTRVIETDRGKLEARYGLAMVHWQQEQWQEMQRELQVIERIDPGNSVSSYYASLCACKLDEPTEKTIPALQAEIKRSGPDAFLFSALGEEYVRAGFADLAEKWFNKAIVLKEDHRPAHRGLIAVFTALGRTKEISGAFKSYLARFGEDTEVRREFIHFLVDAESYKDAASEIRQYMPFQKDDRRLDRLLALCLRKTGQYRDAAIIYRRLLREEPANEDLIRSLIYCMDKLGNRENATALLEQAVAYNKQASPTLLLILGVFYYKGENLEKALAVFRRVAAMAKDDWRAYMNIGMIYKKQGIDSYAQKYIAKAESLRKPKPGKAREATTPRAGRSPLGTSKKKKPRP